MNERAPVITDHDAGDESPALERLLIVAEADVREDLDSGRVELDLSGRTYQVARALRIAAQREGGFVIQHDNGSFSAAVREPHISDTHEETVTHGQL